MPCPVRQAGTVPPARRHVAHLETVINQRLLHQATQVAFIIDQQQPFTLHLSRRRIMSDAVRQRPLIAGEHHDDPGTLVDRRLNPHLAAGLLYETMHHRQASRALLHKCRSALRKVSGSTCKGQGATSSCIFKVISAPKRIRRQWLAPGKRQQVLGQANSALGTLPCHSHIFIHPFHSSLGEASFEQLQATADSRQYVIHFVCQPTRHLHNPFHALAITHRRLSQTLDLMAVSGDVPPHQRRQQLVGTASPTEPAVMTVAMANPTLEGRRGVSLHKRHQRQLRFGTVRGMEQVGERHLHRRSLIPTQQPMPSRVGRAHAQVGVEHQHHIRRQLPGMFRIGQVLRQARIEGLRQLAPFVAGPDTGSGLEQRVEKPGNRTTVVTNRREAARDPGLASDTLSIHCQRGILDQAALALQHLEYACPHTLP
ncbi:hypothetical protein WR25_12216 [Diploscapter pachys]|uniref:Uncharacterized protein n=1 Tax=Diploscapter pachys TaxID=2018661 RepID=A0A2A2K2P2_9BILA|nr:hypothetical protein WR25_12216 [Diploscapter pachys]